MFVSGVASMGLEILAGRIVAPEFGSSIYTWGSVIGVFLAALSLGYHHGGRRATNASRGRLVGVLALATVFVALFVAVSDAVISASIALPLPMRLLPLAPVAVLFGPPTYLLGYVSPYAAELSDTEGVGEASGQVYAVGTVGSIVGAFGTTFLLVPALGVAPIGVLFGLLLVATAVGLSLSNPDRPPAVAAVLVAVVLVGALTSGAVGVSAAGQVVYESETPYQQLRVTDLGDTRTLYLDGQRHSAMDLNEPTRHVFTYTRYFHLPYLFVEDPDQIDRVLFVGGGGFSGPKRFVEEYDARVDVVELDPAVIDVAKRYFGVEESAQLRVYQGDGRRFLRNTDAEYDLIVMDAYRKDKVPFHLTTVEFARLAHDRLSADGVLFANVIAAPSGPASAFYRAQYRTLRQVFPQVYGFPTVGSSFVQNVEVVATKNDSRVSEATLRERNRRRAIGIDLSAEIADYQGSVRTDDVPVLRDDRAPVDRLLEPAVGQRYVVEQTNGSTATPTA